MEANMLRSLKYVFCAILLVFMTASSAHAAWYASSEATKVWTNRQKITISGASVEATLTNFPVLVQITNPANDVFAKAQSDGRDILFTGSDEVTKLNHEIELYSATGTLDAWVRMPTLVSTSDSTIYMYYGCTNATTQENRTAVWDANYRGVWHLKEATGSNMADSTSYGLTLKQYNSPVQKSAQIDGGLRFNGSNQYASKESVATTEVANWTIEGWMNPVVLPQPAYCMVTYNGNDSGGYGFGISNGSGSPGSTLEGLYGSVTGMNTTYRFASANTWYHVAMKRTGGTTYFYVNGAQLAYTSSSTPNTPSSRYTIGCQMTGANAPTRYLSGEVDEFRISNTARSASWIKTEYRNQMYPNSFLTLSAATGRPSVTLTEIFNDKATPGGKRKKS
jgi:hypothetical protein